MNRDQKSAVIDEIAANITDSSAIFAVDYRGITVEQARVLRARLRESDATLRVVKNSLTERAADKAGAEQLKVLLEGPTALTFVRGDGAAAAKSLADFARATQLLAFKGGIMDGAALSPAELTSISRLPSRDVLYGQLVGLVANPITSLARTLNALVGGLAIQLGGILAQREAAGESVPQAEPAAPAADVASEPQASTEGGEGPSAPEAPSADAQSAEEPAADLAEAGSTTEEQPAEEPEASAEAPTTASTSEEESPSEPAPQASADEASSDEPADDSPSSESAQETE
jgi:large subunit ribosomal protein L10